MAVALFAGSFDPPTSGHVELARRARAFCERLVVGVGERAGKEPFFPVEERVALLKECLKGIDGVRVASFQGLAVEFARREGATLLVRGVRGVADFEFERTMALTNRQLAPGIETLLLLPSPEVAAISSSLVKEIARAGGPLERFVPAPVVEALRRRKPG
ncbi:MAG: pantetheine-phosphate adenylyltransferase [Planctomycetaceae bacterium]